MRKIVHIKTIDEKVWQTHPHLLDLSFVKGMLKKYGKKKYSIILKYAFFLRDPLSYFNKSGYSEEERVVEIEHILKEKYSEKLCEDTFEWLLKYNVTVLEKSLQRLLKDLKGFDVMLEDWEWTPGTTTTDPLSAKNRLATVALYDKLYEKIMAIQKRIKSEGDDTGVGRAGYEMSRSEKLAKKYGNK